MAGVSIYFGHGGGSLLLVAVACLILAAQLAEKSGAPPKGVTTFSFQHITLRRFAMYGLVLIAVTCAVLRFIWIPALPPSLSPWIFFAVLAGVGFLFVWLYRPASHDDSSRTPMLVLRLIVAAGIAFLLFRPSVRYSISCAPKPVMWVILDNSKSMSVVDRDGDVSRFHRSRNMALNPTGEFREALNAFDVRFIVASTGGPAHVARADLSDMRADGDGTEIFRFLAAGPDAFQTPDAASRPASPALVVLFTDGLDHSGIAPADAGNGFGRIPINTVLVGELTPGDRVAPDIAVHDIDAPALLSKGERAELTVRGRVKGISGGKTRLILRRRPKPDAGVTKGAAGDASSSSDKTDDQAKPEILADMNVTVFPGPFVHKILFKVDEEGEIPLEVTMLPVHGEELVQNNSLTFTLTAGPAPIRVLYVDLISSESKFLTRHLERDPRIDALVLRKVAPEVFTRRRVGGYGLPASQTGAAVSLDTLSPNMLQDYDVYIIGDLDITHFSNAALAAIADRVRQGAGVMMLGGESSAGRGGYGRSPLADILPVSVSASDSGVSGEYAPIITAAGASHPIFNGISNRFASDKKRIRDSDARLNLWSGCGKVFPDAVVLLTHPRVTGADGRPAQVFVTRDVQAGRSAILLSTSTWTWRTRDRSKSRQDLHAVFWSQAIRWLAKREDDQSVHATGKESIRIWSPRKRYRPGAVVPVFAEVRDSSGRLTDLASVAVTVASDAPEFSPPDAPVPMAGLPNEPGRYRCLLPSAVALPNARLTISVRGNLSAATLGPESTRVTIMPAVSELEETDPDKQACERLAASSGGTFTTINDMDKLGRALLRSGSADPRHGTGDIPLGSGVFWLPVLLGCLSWEWWLRRKKRLL